MLVIFHKINTPLKTVPCINHSSTDKHMSGMFIYTCRTNIYVSWPSRLPDTRSNQWCSTHAEKILMAHSFDPMMLCDVSRETMAGAGLILFQIKNVGQSGRPETLKKYVSWQTHAVIKLALTEKLIKIKNAWIPWCFATWNNTF